MNGVRAAFVGVAFTVLSCAAASADEAFNYRPPDGVVPDAGTAVRIAEAVLAPIYGADTVKREEPFHATLSHGVWHVRGDLHCRECVGGVAEIDISKQDGRVLRISHGV